MRYLWQRRYLTRTDRKDYEQCRKAEGGSAVGKKVAIGIQNFEDIRDRNALYIDKTDFIREWWESGDDVTLITRPRRFGKTLNLSMLESPSNKSALPAY